MGNTSISAWVNEWKSAKSYTASVEQIFVSNSHFTVDSAR